MDFSPCKMYRKGHPIERTANVLKSQWLKTKVNSFIWYLNGRRADILCVPCWWISNRGKKTVALRDSIFNRIRLSFLGSQWKKITAQCAVLSLSPCRILSLGKYTCQVLTSLKFYPSPFSWEAQPETRTAGYLSGHKTSKLHTVGMRTGY